MALVPASSRGADPSAAVDSVFGRTGVVVAASGDYTAAQVTNAFNKAADQTYAGTLTFSVASDLAISITAGGKVLANNGAAATAMLTVGLAVDPTTPRYVLQYDARANYADGTNPADLSTFRAAAGAFGIGTGGTTPNGQIRAGTAVFSALPAADPHVVGELWNNAGVVNVSAG